jgi:hypothetical protein
LIGLEREERKSGNNYYSFGGIRTFPLIGLIGYSIALLSGKQLVPEILGMLAVSGFLMLSYWHKVSSRQSSEMPGVTSELSGIITYLVGALISHDYFWIATTLIVASMLLLALKEVLEGLTQRIEPHEILTFTKFLLLTAVILPVLPNQPFGPFLINPFKTWLVVVAVSAVSYGSYLLLRYSKNLFINRDDSSAGKTIHERDALPSFCRKHAGCFGVNVYAIDNSYRDIQPESDANARNPFSLSCRSGDNNGAALGTKAGW